MTAIASPSRVVCKRSTLQRQGASMARQWRANGAWLSAAPARSMKNVRLFADLYRQICGGALIERDDLARIHDVLRIERAFYRRHGRECRRAVLRQHVFHLALADAVL